MRHAKALGPTPSFVRGLCLLALVPLLSTLSCTRPVSVAQPKLAAPSARATSGGAELLGWHLDKREYFTRGGANVMAFSDFYPEGHQGGVTVVQDGVRLLAGGDVRLEQAPGQWQPVPKMLSRSVDSAAHSISARLRFPDESKDRRGFNPVEYPDLELQYDVHVTSDGDDIRVVVDLDEPLPAAWVGRVGFNLELFPGEYFGRTFDVDGRVGMFPRQVNGPVTRNATGQVEAGPLASGQVLNVAPEDAARHLTLTADTGALTLLDGRVEHNNGWFVVRVPLRAGTTNGAAQLRISTHGKPGWQYGPVVHLSQVGYHPGQSKIAVLELDPRAEAAATASLIAVLPDGSRQEVLSAAPEDWGTFLRYHYLRFDFSSVTSEGSYLVHYGNQDSNVFQISRRVFERGVWQPTLEYFLPVQMCHMRVNDSYRVWHGECHKDDARMAPTDFNHIDGYIQGASTLTPFASGQTVPGLNVGGWHDAGDFDLRVESQAGTVRLLAQMYEEFNVALDSTTIDQARHLVEIHRPDGKPDILQQIEHGVLNILGGYEAMGRLYRGVIEPTIPQYVLLGDGANITDGVSYNSKIPANAKHQTSPLPADDRWVFTEENPAREMEVAAGLAAAARALKSFDPELSARCLRAARQLVPAQPVLKSKAERGALVQALAELWFTTREAGYQSQLQAHRADVLETLDEQGWVLGRLRRQMPAPEFWAAVDVGLVKVRDRVTQQARQTPFGVPYEPNIWGAGWAIQEFAVRQYFLVEGWPELFTQDYLLSALNFVLGNHPGANTASFASGVGARSMTIAYGANRADFSYIPGGVASGTALIRPDLPELKDWPYFWQQGEYVIGGGAENFMFMVLAAEHWLGAAK